MKFSSSATVQDVSFEGVQSGLMMQGVLQLSLQNSSEDSPLEVSVRCRSLPGSLSKFTADLSSGAHIESFCREKKEAQAVYDDAISEARSAVLLEMPDAHSFSLLLGAFQPKETCILRVEKTRFVFFALGKC